MTDSETLAGLVEEVERLKEKSSEQEKTVELLAGTITEYQKYLQTAMTELTRHFMASVEPAIRILVISEVKDFLNKLKPQ